MEEYDNVYPSRSIKDQSIERGLTVRDHIAIEAMNGFLSGGQFSIRSTPIEEIASCAYGLADAMIKESNK